MLIGIVGKTNVGKSTFFSAATLLPVEIANRPFTTIKPNRGIAAIRSPCVCREMGVKDEICTNGVRFTPVELIDVAGLVPGAHQGRGLGNKFLDDLRQADVFIHVVDASGSTDPEGRLIGPGTFNPLDDVKFLEYEMNEWIAGIVSKDWERWAKQLELKAIESTSAIAERLSGLGFDKRSVEQAMVKNMLVTKKLSVWSMEDIRSFSTDLRRIGKPSVIAANKADIPASEPLIEDLRRHLDVPVIPVISEAELALKRAVQKGLIIYRPGDSAFQTVDQKVTPGLQGPLEKLAQLLKKHGGTGVQDALEAAVFKSYGGIIVYPVEDTSKFTDKNGRVLPDAFILRKGSKPKDLARKVHSELAERFAYAIDARTKQRLSAQYELKDGDIIKIVAG